MKYYLVFLWSILLIYSQVTLAQNAKFYTEKALAERKIYGKYLAYADSALSLDPYNIPCLKLKIIAMQEGEDNFEASKIINKAIKLHPNIVDFYLLRAQNNVAIDSKSQTLADYQKCIQLAKTDSQKFLIYDSLIGYYEMNGDNKSTIKYLNKALNIYPENFNTIYRLGIAYFANSNIKEAIYYLEKAEMLKLQDTKILQYLKVLYEQEQDFANLERVNYKLKKYLKPSPRINLGR